MSMLRYRNLSKLPKRSCESLDNVKGAWVKEQKVIIKRKKICEYRVTLMVTFVLND